jgi:hypothetical protein
MAARTMRLCRITLLPTRFDALGCLAAAVATRWTMFQNKILWLVRALPNPSVAA